MSQVVQIEITDTKQIIFTKPNTMSVKQLGQLLFRVSKMIEAKQKTLIERPNLFVPKELKNAVSK